MSVLFVYGAKEPQIEMTQEGLSIGGMYSNYISKENIKEINLQGEIPRVVEKVGGFDLGHILRGSFTLEDKELVNLSIYEKKPPYIIINTENGRIILNYKNGEKTNKVYKELDDWMKD